MPKTKSGEQISWKEFFKRWRTGMEGVTPLQQTVAQMQGTVVALIGILCGVVISIIGFKQMWWLTIILVAALWNTGWQYLGMWQKKQILKRMTEV